MAFSLSRMHGTLAYARPTYDGPSCSGATTVDLPVGTQSNQDPESGCECPSPCHAARGDPAARDRLSRMTRVAGGGNDIVVLPYNAPAPLNFGGLWWNDPAGSESGWGLTFAHQGDVIFATWLTYDAHGRPWWLIAELRRTTGNACAGPVSTVTGPPFNAVPWDRTRVVETAVGAATVGFADGNNATFAYTVSGMAQTKRITRQVFSPPGIICR